MKSTKLLAVPRYFAAFALASALALPVWAQQAQPSATDSQSAPSSSAQQASDQSTTLQPLAPAKEGFWGRVNPFARKKWVKKQTDPINDRLTELDQVNARNASQIKDVDARAQAGIKKAQDSADAASQVASSANQMAMNANNTAQQASSHVEKLNSTVNGLDQYSQISNLDIDFRGANPALTDAARTKLDQFAAGLAGREGYIIELDAQSPAAGSVGIQNSQRLAEAVERYLVTAHQIPIYRMHAVALGNASAPAAGDQSPARVRTSTVHLQLMENSLAAPSGASPQNATAAAGAEQQ